MAEKTLYPYISEPIWPERRASILSIRDKVTCEYFFNYYWKPISVIDLYRKAPQVYKEVDFNRKLDQSKHLFPETLQPLVKISVLPPQRCQNM